jgi:hypothetical protein
LFKGQDVEGERDVHLLGRLNPEISQTQAEAALMPVLREIRRRNPNNPAGSWRVRLRSFEATFPSGITDALWILFGAVGLLLLIACLNVSSLLLSRLLVRQKEISIRASLGATRGSLIRQTAVGEFRDRDRRRSARCGRGRRGFARNTGHGPSGYDSA